MAFNYDGEGALNQNAEHDLVYRELARNIRPPRVITALEHLVEGWEYPALRMLENYSVTWGGAGGLLIPVTAEGSVHEALWPVMEIFDADLWAVYHRTLRDHMLSDPGTFEQRLHEEALGRVQRHGETVESARAMLTADHVLNETEGQFRLSPELLEQITRRTAPVLHDDSIPPHLFSADGSPGWLLMNVCALRPLPDRVTVMDTSRLPLPLRVLVAMRCGGLGPRQQRLLENAGTRVHRVDVGPEDLDELLALCWRGQHDPPRVILDRDALMASRLAEKDAAGNYVYMVPSGLSILGCQVLQRLRSWHFGKPLTLVIGSTADDFAYALALDRCGLPAWWVPEPRSIQDDSIATRMLATLAASITSEWLPFEQSGRGSGVEACSLSIPRGDLKLLCTQVDKAGFGIFGTTLSDVARATVPSWRISLVTLRDHASEPLHEPFRHEHMLRPVSAAPPSGITSTPSGGYIGGLTSRTAAVSYPTGLPYTNCSSLTRPSPLRPFVQEEMASATTRSGAGCYWQANPSGRRSHDHASASQRLQRYSDTSSNALDTGLRNPPLAATAG